LGNLKKSDLQIAAVIATGSATKSFSMTHQMGLLKGEIPAAATADNVIVYDGNTYNGSATGEKWTRVTAECTSATWNASTTFTSSTNKPYYDTTNKILYYVAKAEDATISISATAGTQLYAWSVSGDNTTVSTKNVCKSFTIATPDYSNAFNQKIWKFSYSGEGHIQEWKAPLTGVYELEIWGAQGGNGFKTGYDAGAYIPNGGKGGYTNATGRLSANDSYYIVVGGAGSDGQLNSYTVTAGGYNGGGDGAWNHKYVGNNTENWYGRAGSGGGATHIGLNNGLLTTYSSNYGSKLLIVAGGGGGGCIAATSYKGVGGAGGGTSGTNGGASNGNPNLGYAGGQTSSNGTIFGQGGTRNCNTGTQPGGGGGGGFYGGVAGGYGGTIYAGGGGGGSGYVNSSLVTGITYVGTSSFKSPSGINETGHTGNGYARITYTKP